MARPLATPNISESEATFTVYSGGTINASAITIYNALIDTATWPEWSTFVPRVTITSQPSGTDQKSSILTNGTTMTFGVQMTSLFKALSFEKGDPIPPPPQASDPPGTKYIVGWSAVAPWVLIRAQRVNEITTTSDPNVCEYCSYETFGGPLATAVKYLLEKTLIARFGDWTRDLTAYCEKKQRAGQV